MTDVEIEPGAPEGNAKPYSVSELAFALKRTLEDAYGFVRVRAELSKVTRHASGHVYLTLKDDKASIDGVVWKGQVRGLKAQPEQGLEVIVTGASPPIRPRPSTRSSSRPWSRPASAPCWPSWSG
jgi:exodeoxyribonuclease VII large subunit